MQQHRGDSVQNTGNNCFCGGKPLHSCSFLQNENLPLVDPERSALHVDMWFQPADLPGIWAGCLTPALQEMQYSFTSWPKLKLPVLAQNDVHLVSLHCHPYWLHCDGGHRLFWRSEVFATEKHSARDSGTLKNMKSKWADLGKNWGTRECTDLLVVWGLLSWDMVGPLLRLKVCDGQI